MPLLNELHLGARHKTHSGYLPTNRQPPRYTSHDDLRNLPAVSEQSSDFFTSIDKNLQTNNRPSAPPSSRYNTHQFPTYNLPSSRAKMNLSCPFSQLLMTLINQWVIQLQDTLGGLFPCIPGMASPWLQDFLHEDPSKLGSPCHLWWLSKSTFRNKTSDALWTQ